jgi:hypothetical protein
MQPTRFDRISKAFAGKPLLRSRALATSAAAANGSAPADTAQGTRPTPDAERGPTMLFVQTFQSGTIAPKEDAEGRYTLTLEAGTGQTVYFSNRPDRIVGANPTPQFLEGLGFPPDNPPNAALVVETAPGESDVAVVELFNPTYDPETLGVSYEVAVLANWQYELDMELQEAPTDLAALAPSFGAARLFIDDCPDGTMICYRPNVPFNEWWENRVLNDPSEIVGTISNGDHDGFCYNWEWMECLPCQPWIHNLHDSYFWWTEECNDRFPQQCENSCQVWGLCTTSGGGRCY